MGLLMRRILVQQDTYCGLPHIVSDPLIRHTYIIFCNHNTTELTNASNRCIMSWRGSRLKNLWMLLDNITSALFILIPFIIIVTCTIWLFVFLKRVIKIQKQSIMLILSVGITYLISFVPYLLYVVLANILKLTPAEKYRDEVVAQVYTGVLYVNYLNTMCNPVLYYFTSASFNRYVRRYSSDWWGRLNGTQKGPIKNLDLSSDTLSRENARRSYQRETKN